MSSYFGLSVRSYIYWQYFSPSLWLFAGEPVDFASTRHVGAVLLPIGIPVVVGLYELAARRRPLDLLVLSGLAIAPIAAALEPSTVTLRRALIALPFVALTATAGFERLFRGHRLARGVGWLVAILTVAQSAVFLSLYFGAGGSSGAVGMGE